MTSLLAAELAFLVLLGIGVGTGLGVFASRLLVPFCRWRKCAITISALPDPDRVAFHHADLCAVRHFVLCRLECAVWVTCEDEDLPGNKTWRNDLGMSF